MAITYDEYNRPILETQHPDADLDYVIEWETWLASHSDGDIISTASVTADRGVTIYSVTFDDYNVVFWAKEGSTDNTYRIKCVISTNNSRTAVFEMLLPFGFTQSLLSEA